MLSTKCSLLFLGLIVLEVSAKAADYIKPCRITNDNDCYLSSAKKALPFITPKADPLLVGDVNADTGDLKLKFKDIVLTGFKNCNVLNLERNERLKAKVKIECPVTVTGQYTLDGKLLGVEIDGEGPIKIQTDKIQIDINIFLKLVKGKDNEDHYKIDKFDYEYQPIAPASFNFENLYGGDEAKAAPFITILNDVNVGKELLKTIGKPVVEVVVKKVISGPVNDVFKENATKDIELA